MPAKCSNCQFENPDGFAFCGRCGARLDASPAGSEWADREATIKQLRQAGDEAKCQADYPAALERYQQALALIDSVALATDATLHVQLLKSRFDILAERYPLWALVGRSDRIEADLQEMLALARRAGDGQRLSVALTALARHYIDQHDDEAARPLLEEAVSLTHSQTDRPGEAEALALLAHLNWRAGRLDSVPDALQRAHELRRHVADPIGLARSYFDLGLLYRDGQSHAFHAVSHFEKSIELAHHAGDIELELRGLIALGVSWCGLGQFAKARAALDEAQSKAASLSSPVQPAWLLVARADLQRETGSPDARATVDQAIAMAIDLDVPELEWHALLSRARIDQAAGAWSASRAPIDRMQSLDRGTRLHAYCAIWSSALLAHTLLHTDPIEPAAAASLQAVNALQSHGFVGVPMPQAILWTRYAVLSAARDPSAFHFLRQARELMLSQANTIGDGALRAAYLRDVSINRAIGDDWIKQHS